MADLSIDFAGIRSPNPFWLASAPPANSGAQVHKAFEAGWGGAVWKTIGAPVLNVSNRYGAWHYGNQKMLAINNVELISDRPLEVNLSEIKDVKRLWPDRAVIVSAMVESTPEAWSDIVHRIEDTGADGIEFNYGCPHGMSERGMGAAVGQVPEYCEQITGWVKNVARIPVIVKLTPNITNIVYPARAAVAAHADGLSLINTINSIVGVDLDTLEVTPSIGGKAGHGGYAGPAVKPIALNMLCALGVDEVVAGSRTAHFRNGWNFHLERCGRVSAAGRDESSGMHGRDALRLPHHRRFVRWTVELDGRSSILRPSPMFGERACRIFPISRTLICLFGPLRASILPNASNAICATWRATILLINALISSRPTGAKVEPRSYDVHSNGKQDAIATRPQPRVREEDCVGCRLCYNVCPVEHCIEMVELPPCRPSVTWDELSTSQPDVTESWDAMKRYRDEHGIHIH